MIEEEETIEVCIWCGEPTEEKHLGTEGWTVCPGCGTVEGDTKEISLKEYESK